MNKQKLNVNFIQITLDGKAVKFQIETKDQILYFFVSFNEAAAIAARIKNVLRI